ncbi:MAG: chemotaxis protein CheW [Candidatus Dormibacteraceae bacterium]
MTADSGAILAQRARKLAMPLAAATGSTTEPMLGFTLGEERFLAPLHSVREVASLDSITPIPGLPFVFAGLTTVRGDIVPVLDVRGFLGLPEHRPERAERILIVESEGVPAGVWVDRMHGLIAVDAALLTVDHGLSSAAFRGRTADLSTVIDLSALVAAARRTESTNPPAEEA